MRQGVGIVLVIVALLAPLHRLKAAEPLWSAQSGDYTVTWSAQDITAGRRSAPPGYSARQFAAAGFALGKADLGTGPGARMSMGRRIRVISLVGPLLSLEDAAILDYQPSAHPAGETRAWTFDLRRSGRYGVQRHEVLQVEPIGPHQLVSLTDLFAAADLYRALAAHPLIVSAGATGTRSLGELLELFRLFGGAAKPDAVMVPADLLTRFRLLDVSRQGVRVRIDVPGMGCCVGVPTVPMDIALPFRGKITAAIDPANAPLRRPPDAIPPLSLSFDAVAASVR